ncbi:MULTISPECIES: DUF262 domain-containing protein [unclassified Leifsonia]|uniref:DUF262 domain-containing protein n=1 Tax=unclassified Leifsonia TaxID=2663824 RepID=UPI0003A67807|nr:MULTISPECIES: DUF262 domain-containing protein [unclassified Leifsonia]TDP99354.1 uncharacterized protein DUF262 [Leifsonia sp. 115AMFTsu3.1]
METQLAASSTTAGGLFSGGRFHVPRFQREYAWEDDEVTEFFRDLSTALNDETYFLGLVIVTGKGHSKDVVDGQQRLLTLTLLVAALYHEALKYERRALAERLQSTFLKSIDFQTDAEVPRVSLSSGTDDDTLRQILATPATLLSKSSTDDFSVSTHLINAYGILSDALAKDLTDDPFRRLGTWADFITNKLYFAVFVHPDPASAYRVFEVINTRGRELTTADLLKSYVLSQTSADRREARYQQWQRIAETFSAEASSSFVQFIRHAVTIVRGHVLPRDLYDVLTGRGESAASKALPMSPDELLSLLELELPLYAQTDDPTLDGPADSAQLAVFSILNALNVVSVRPIILAMAKTANATEGMRRLLQLVVQRIVVGNLGTGNVERRFGQVAQRIAAERAWEGPLESLSDLEPDGEEFRIRVSNRSMNRNVLGVIRSSVLQNTITPNLEGYVYLIKPRNSEWTPADEDRAAYWVSTVGNTFLANESRRPMGSSTWSGFRAELLPRGVPGEWTEKLESFSTWGVDEISVVGEEMAALAADIWYR